MRSKAGIKIIRVGGTNTMPKAIITRMVGKRLRKLPKPLAVYRNMTLGTTLGKMGMRKPVGKKVVSTGTS